MLIFSVSTSAYAQDQTGKKDGKNTKCYMCPDEEEGDASAECTEKEWIKAKTKKSCEAKGGTWVGKAKNGKKKKSK